MQPALPRHDCAFLSLGNVLSLFDYVGGPDPLRVGVLFCVSCRRRFADRRQPCCAHTISASPGSLRDPYLSSPGYCSLVELSRGFQLWISG